MSKTDTMPITLASYNIHRCVGRDGRYDPDRVMRVIEELDADVLALQEVESHPGSERDFLALLARESGMRVIPGPTLLHGGYHYGNALLTRARVQSVRRIDLSLLDREPRGALHVDVEWESQPLQVVATHLGLRPLERRFQIRQLLEIVREEQVQTVALLGDINEWVSWGRPLRWLHGRFGKPPSPATFPAAFPMLSLDRIWFCPRECLTGVSAHRSTLSRLASDHLPITASADLACSAGSASGAPGRG